MSTKTLLHIDKKELSPKDSISTTPSKTIIGKPSVYKMNPDGTKGELLAKETNLVVLRGREFLAQKLMPGVSNSGEDLSNYRLDYFGVGSGGTAGGTTPTTIGPYDNDIDLVQPAIFSSSGIHSSVNGYKYISDGYLKKIDSDGSVEIIREDHIINTNTGNIELQRYTSIKFVIKIDQNEPTNKPFKFSEAGLFAVKYIDDVPTDEKLLFARFTTLDKYLDTSDGIIIEWHVLV